MRSDVQSPSIEVTDSDLERTASKKAMDISKDLNKSMTNLASLEKDSEVKDSEFSKSCEDVSKNSDVLLFGEDLKKHPLDGSIEFPSDQVF